MDNITVGTGITIASGVWLVVSISNQLFMRSMLREMVNEYTKIMEKLVNNG